MTNKYVAHCSEPSFDGKWHARYPAGNAPGVMAVLGLATSKSSGSGPITTKITAAGLVRSVVRNAVSLATAIVLTSTANAVSAAVLTSSLVGTAPVLLVTDIVSGSATNGEGGAGAYLRLYCLNPGTWANVGTSAGAQVTIGGQPIDNYRYLQPAKVNGVRPGCAQVMELCVQIGSAQVQALTAGTPHAIGFTVGGVAANTTDVMGNPFNFTIQPGHFYYVKTTTGSDSTGVVDDPTHPYRYYQFNTAPTNMNSPSYTGIWSVLKPGDTIVGMDDVGTPVQDQVGTDNRLIRCANRDGGTAPNGTIGNGYIHITAYPGAANANAPLHPYFLCPSGGKGGIMGASTAYVRGGTNGTNYGAYVSVSGWKMDMASGGTMGSTDSCPINLQNSADHWRVIGNEFSWNTSSTNGLAATVSGNGDPLRVSCNYVHDVFGGASGLQFHGIYFDGSNTDAHNVECDFNVVINCNTGQCMMCHSEANDGFFNIYWHHNWCENSAKYCTKIDGFSGKFWMWNNVAVGSNRDGFGFENDGAAGGSTTGFVGHVENNTFYNCYNATSGPLGVLVNEGETSTLLGSLDFSNNVLGFGPGTSGYQAQWTSFAGCPATTNGNVYYDSSGRLTTKPSSDTTGIYGNTQFANTATFPNFDARIGPSSAAVGRAVNAAINPSNDLGMNPNPRSGQSGRSCGAFA